MDSGLYLKILTIYVLIGQVSTDRQIIVNKSECGRTVELKSGEKLYMLYNGGDIGDVFTPCVFNFINNNEDDSICIQTENKNYFNFDCALSLRYYVKSYSGPSFEYHSCSDFRSRPLCDRNRRSSLVYQSILLYRNSTTKVWLYTQKYIPTTTAAPWNSWTSWSSNSYNSDDDTDTNVTGSVVGVVGVVVAVLLTVIVCAKVCRRSSTPKPEYGPPQVQYSAQTQQLNQSGNQPMYPPNTTGSQLQTQYTAGQSQFAGYHVHQPVFQQIPDADNSAGNQPTQINNIQPSAPADINVPPPPYPGY